MSLFDKIRGQERALNILRTAINNKKASGSYLFYGNKGIGKFTTALYFGMALNCESEDKPCGKCVSCQKFLSFSHPDFIYLFPSPNLKFQLDGSYKEEKFSTEYESYIEMRRNYPWRNFSFSQRVEIRIDAIRMLIHRLSLSTHESKYKVCLIENVDLMNINTANAFLKTLEEPPSDTVILLTSSRPDFLLPTILSRCQKVSFNPLSIDEIQNELIEMHGVEASQSRLLARVANGSMEKALQLLEEGESEIRIEASNLKTIIIEQNDLDFWEFLANHRGKPPDWLEQIIMHLQITLSDLGHYRHNPNYIVNIDRTSIIEDMYHQNPQIDEKALDLIRFLEGCQKKLKGNVNQQLILLEIYKKLGDLYKK